MIRCDFLIHVVRETILELQRKDKAAPVLLPATVETPVQSFNVDARIASRNAFKPSNAKPFDLDRRLPEPPGITPAHVKLPPKLHLEQLDGQCQQPPRNTIQPCFPKVHSIPFNSATDSKNSAGTAGCGSSCSDTSGSDSSSKGEVSNTLSRLHHITLPPIQGHKTDETSGENSPRSDYSYQSPVGGQSIEHSSALSGHEGVQPKALSLNASDCISDLSKKIDSQATEIECDLQQIKEQLSLVLDSSKSGPSVEFGEIVNMLKEMHNHLNKLKECDRFDVNPSHVPTPEFLLAVDAKLERLLVLLEKGTSVYCGCNQPPCSHKSSYQVTYITIYGASLISIL